MHAGQLDVIHVGGGAGDEARVLFAADALADQGLPSRATDGDEARLTSSSARPPPASRPTWHPPAPDTSPGPPNPPA